MRDAYGIGRKIAREGDIVLASGHAGLPLSFALLLVHILVEMSMIRSNLGSSEVWHIVGFSYNQKSLCARRKVPFLLD